MAEHDGEVGAVLAVDLRVEAGAVVGADGQGAITKKLVRERVIRDGLRIDGRGLKDIRQLTAEA
ncbi:hypothetical protein, partial [Actinomadura sp. NPDC000929]|uniref:hypothetical protein n=1 Tax=Actinomadura sp. NPDC000929 TaxID=3154517 RepID=UPI003394BF28